MELLIGILAIVTASWFVWPAFIILAILIAIALENENMPWTLFFTTVVASGLIYVKWFAHTEITLGVVGIAIAGYLLIGTGWAGLKWINKLRKLRTKFIEIRDKYLRDNNLPADYFRKEILDDKDTMNHQYFIRELKDERGFSNAYCARNAQEALSRIIPQVSDNKGTVILWIAYWPLSVLVFLFNDMLSEVFETIYSWISEWFQSISNRMFKDLI